MSMKYKYFTFNLTLEHITMIKISSQLWKSSDVIEQLHGVIIDITDPDFYFRSDESFISYVIEEKCSKLLLPPKIRNNLEYFVREMGKQLLEWLRDAKVYLKYGSTPEDCREKLSFFIENIYWTDIGSIDIKKIIEYYADNKKIIDFPTWNYLCCYSSEDYIIKYGQTVNWNESRRINSKLFVFWYYKIFNKFPEQRALTQSAICIQNEISNGNNHLYKEILCTILITKSGTLSSVKYFWNKLTEYEKSGLLIEILNSLIPMAPDVYIYLLESMKNKDFIKFFDSAGVYDFYLSFSMNFPWILCCDSYSHPSKNLTRSNQRDFEMILSKIVRKINCERIRESSPEILCRKYLQVFAEFWDYYDGYCKEQMPTHVLHIFVEAIAGENLDICEIIFKGSSQRRENVIKTLISLGTFSKKLNTDFIKNFVDRILLNDEEKLLFRRLLSD